MVRRRWRGKSPSPARGSRGGERPWSGPAPTRWRHPIGGRLASRESQGSTGARRSFGRWVQGERSLPRVINRRYDCMARQGSMPSKRQRPEGCNGRAQRLPCQDCGYYPAHLAISDIRGSHRNLPVLWLVVAPPKRRQSGSAHVSCAKSYMHFWVTHFPSAFIGIARSPFQQSRDRWKRTSRSFLRKKSGGVWG